MTHSITVLLSVLLVTQVISMERISVPHDVHPGYSIKQLHSKGRILNLVENDISPYFTLLDNGCLISTTNLTHLANSSLDLLIEEENDGQTIVQPITIHIRDRNKMMKFPKIVYDGNINENELPYTTVENLNSLYVLNSVGKVTYALSGSDFAVLQDKDVVSIISTKSLDKEMKNLYLLHLNATDSEGCTASTTVKIIVNDVNDNPPVFKKKYYSWNIKPDVPVYSTIGLVKAIDADGDKPVYKFMGSNSSHAFIIVPQTGEIIVMYEPEVGVYNYFVIASDNREKPKFSDIIPLTVRVSDDNEFSKSLRRKKRSIRQTRTYEHFLESDGSIPGKVMFRLDSVHPDEIFSLENESRWIDVDHNGDVKVREPWDYEQLEREKTIDFWVLIRAPQQPGKISLNFLK